MLLLSVSSMVADSFGQGVWKASRRGVQPNKTGRPARCVASIQSSYPRTREGRTSCHSRQESDYAILRALVLCISNWTGCACARRRKLRKHHWALLRCIRINIWSCVPAEMITCAKTIRYSRVCQLCVLCRANARPAKIKTCVLS
jgi:hypothetical protein